MIREPLVLLLSQGASVYSNEKEVFRLKSGDVVGCSLLLDLKVSFILELNFSEGF